MTPYDERPADQQMHAGEPAAQANDQAIQQTAALFEQIPPEVGFVIVDIALNMPEVFQVLTSMPPEELQELHAMYEQALGGAQQPQEGMPQEPMPEEQHMYL